jgi:hypothetical protein
MYLKTKTKKVEDKKGKKSDRPLSDSFMAQLGDYANIETDLAKIGFDLGVQAAKEHPECAGSAEYFNDHYTDKYGVEALFKNIFGMNPRDLIAEMRACSDTRALFTAITVKTVVKVMAGAFFHGIQTVVPLVSDDEKKRPN